MQNCGFGDTKAPSWFIWKAFQEDKAQSLRNTGTPSVSGSPLSFMGQEGHIDHLAVFQLLNCVQLFAIPWTAARQASAFHHL